MLMHAPMPLIKILIIAVWFAALALGERLRPASPRPIGSDRVRLPRNLGLWAANTLINPILVVPITIAAAAFDLWTRPAFGFWPGLALDIVMLDLWVYIWHRANHELPLLWRFHRIHHLDQFLDASSAVRFHPGEVLLSALARAPLIVLADIPLTSIALFDTLVLAAALFHHSNVRLPAKFEAALRLVLVTPSHHWVHHHVAVRDTDSNYATVFTVWDRLFSSLSPTVRTPEMAIGTSAAIDAPLLSLVAAPFWRQG